MTISEEPNITLPFTDELKNLKATWHVYEDNIIENDTESIMSENSIRVSLFIDDCKLGDIYYRSNYCSDVIEDNYIRKSYQSKFICDIVLFNELSSLEYTEHNIIEKETLEQAMMSFENHIVERINNYSTARDQVKLLFNY